jgi:hypothetical protein
MGTDEEVGVGEDGEADGGRRRDADEEVMR